MAPTMDPAGRSRLLLAAGELFTGLDNGFEKLFDCLGAEWKIYETNEVAALDGTVIGWIGVVLSGRLQLVRHEDDHLHIADQYKTGELFGATFAFTEQPLNGSLITAEPTELLTLPHRNLFDFCVKGCLFHQRLLRNLFTILAAKNNEMAQKLECLSQRTTRDKLLAYLRMQKNAANERGFAIPFDRAGLADYLCVDRSALSRELCKMRDEGLITFYKNIFILE